MDVNETCFLMDAVVVDKGLVHNDFITAWLVMLSPSQG